MIKRGEGDPSSKIASLWAFSVLSTRGHCMHREGQRLNAKATSPRMMVIMMTWMGDELLDGIFYPILI